MIYVLVAVALLFLTVLVYYHRQFNSPVGWIAAILIVVIAAIRMNTGTDTKTYVLIWEATPPWEDISLPLLFGGYLEPGFLLLNSGLHEFLENPAWFFLLYAAITMLILRAGLEQLRINQCHALLIYVCIFFLPYTINGMRQAVAMSFFVFAIPLIQRGDGRRVWLTGIFAASFHLTGILIIVAHYLQRVLVFRLSRLKYYLIGMSVAGMLLGYSGVVGALVFKLFPSKHIYQDVFNEGTSLFQLVSRLILAATLVFFAERTKNRSQEIRNLMVIYIFGLGLYLMLADFNVLATRFNMFFRTLEIVCIPMIYRELSSGRRAIFAIITFAAAFATLLVTGFLPDYEYQTIFEQQ